MMKLSESDRVAVARYTDGEMGAGERTAFEDRLRVEPALQEVLAETEALRGVFAVARDAACPALRPGLADRVLQRLQRGAPVAEPAAGDRVLRLARISTLAAAVVFAVAVLFATGVLRLPDQGRLQADAAAELIRVLDAQIAASQAPPGTLPR
jgi:hypothetical protein